MPVITTALLLGLPPEIGPLTRAGERPHRLKIYMVAISPVLGPVHVGRIVPARVVRSSEFVINVHSMPRTNGLQSPRSQRHDERLWVVVWMFGGEMMKNRADLARAIIGYSR